MAASIGVASKKSPMSDRLMKALFLAGAFVLGALVIFLFYQLFGGTKGSVHPGEWTGNATTPAPAPKLLIKDMLLPKDPVPSQYDFRLKAYLPGYGTAFPKEKELAVEANVVVHLKTIKGAVDEVVLHAVDLTFDKEHCFAETHDGSRIPIKEIEVKEKLQFAIFKLSQPVTGEFRLSITYEGKIRSELNGLYQTKYTNGRGEQKIAAATQMEPLDARKMVPCFDEPEWKAIWNVTILHPRGTRAVSNGIELGESQPTDGDFLQTSFQQTPAMSSYLLAVVISDFEYSEGMTKRGIRFRIWSRPEAKETTKYALTAGIRCLEGLEEFYGVNFPLKKQDMVALPDFAMGAMENWGLITYRETALLYDEKNYNMENKRRVATVIAHELAHMWFGDLVTMKWWDDIWLNEGFASFVENIGVDIIAHGKFDMEATFVTEQHAWTLGADSSRSSHPIVNKVDTAEEIMDVFDTISYKKGASFISMVNHLMGKENFMRGIKSYFHEYSYKNAEHAQLFAELDKAVPEGVLGPDGKTKLNITEFALKWTLQMGYPYLSLVAHNATHDEVTQTRYLVNANATELPKFANPKYKYNWDVPVWYQVGSSKDVQLAWLPYEGHLFLPKTSEALVLNADSYAIARMNYDEAGWRKILEQLKKDNSIYSQRTKYRMLSDVFAMAQVEKVSYDLALDFAQYVVNEEGRLPWTAFLEQIDSIRDFYGTSPDSKFVDAYSKKLLEPIAKGMDIDGVVASIVDEESHIAKGIQISQWVSFCRVSPKDCLAKKKQIFDETFREPCSENELQASECTRVPNPIRQSIYCDAVKHGDEDVFDLILSKFKKESLQLKSVKLLNALCCTQKVVQIKWLLAEAGLNRGKGIIRGQDAATVFQYLSRNEVGSELLLDFLLENWDQIYKNYGLDQSILNKIISTSTNNIRTRYQLKKLKSFVQTDSVAQKYFTFTKAEQDAEKTISWLEKNGKTMVDLLKKKTSQF